VSASEHHTDFGAQQVDILITIQNIFAVINDFAFSTLTRIQVVHTV
jgi:hypothetical protein